MQKTIYLALRLVMGFIFIWAFLDKLFGLGFATPKTGAWLNGGSPTAGFLGNAVKGPFASIFSSMAGVPLVDWLFMLGLLFVGVTLLLNKFVFWGGLAGAVMVVLMWLAVLPPENNPVVDDHIVYALVLALFAIRAKKQNG